MPAKSYSMPVIIDAWKKYRATRVFLVLKQGIWAIQKNPGTRPDGVRAKVTTADKAMSFPKFLKDYYD